MGNEFIEIRAVSRSENGRVISSPLREIRVGEFERGVSMDSERWLADSVRKVIREMREAKKSVLREQIGAMPASMLVRERSARIPIEDLPGDIDADGQKRNAAGEVESEGAD